MNILQKMVIILAIYEIPTTVSQTTTEKAIINITKPTEIKKIKRGVIGLSQAQSQLPSGHFHYYPFAHNQHSSPVLQNQPPNGVQPAYAQNRPIYEINPIGVKPVQDNTPDSQYSYQFNPQDSGFVGQLDQPTISPYFPIAPLADSAPQYAPTNHYNQASSHLHPNPQPAAQFPVHIEPYEGGTEQRGIPIAQTAHYHSTVQHYPAYWNGNPAQSQYPHQQPIKYPSLLNGNKPQLPHPQSYPVNNPGSVAPQTFSTQKHYYPQNGAIKYYNNQPTVAPMKYTLSSSYPVSFTTPSPLSPYVKNHPLRLLPFKKPTPQPKTKEQQKSDSHQKEEEYDDDKSDTKDDQGEDIEEDEAPNRSTNRKPKYNSYKSSYNDDDDDYYSRFRYRDSDDDEDEYSNSPVREDRDEDEESDAATPHKTKTKYDNKKSVTNKPTNSKSITNKGNRYRSKSNIQKPSGYRPKTKTDLIEGKYSQHVPVTTDQKSKSHYQAKWYSYSSVKNNED